jgi:outer membrane protein assembly factor BamB
VWGSTLVADGKVYLGNENGLLTVLAAGREAKKLGEIDFAAPVYATPVAANGVLYVATDKHLYALQQK